MIAVLSAVIMVDVGWLTVKVTDFVVVPPGPVAVIVYVVVVVGPTVREPEFATVPISWLIKTLVTWPVTFHERIDVEFLQIAVGDKEKETDGG
jgi:hypothetical protein